MNSPAKSSLFTAGSWMFYMFTYVHICSGSCIYQYLSPWCQSSVSRKKPTGAISQSCRGNLSGEILRASMLIFLLTVLTCFDVWAGYEYAKGLGASSWITGSIALALQMSLLTLPSSQGAVRNHVWSSKANRSNRFRTSCSRFREISCVSSEICIRFSKSTHRST